MMQKALFENLRYPGGRSEATSEISTNFFVWGLDLSGSLQGAGGVGGLLAVSEGQRLAVHYPFYDGNGNITDWMDADGTLAAHHEYDPYGNETTGNPPASFGFSTKPLDATLGLYYYGYRFYRPDWGRWINRDPIGEEGGGLYLFANNNVYGFIDFKGLFSCAVGTIENATDGLTGPGGVSFSASTKLDAWSFSFSVKECPKSRKKKVITDYSPVCAMTIRYGVGISPMDPSSGGGTIEGHEQGHVTIHEQYATLIDDAIRPQVDNCMCEPCISSTAAYLSELVGYYTVYDFYAQALYDCNSYQPGYPKDLLCRIAQGQRVALLRLYYQTVLPAFKKMQKDCG